MNVSAHWRRRGGQWLRQTFLPCSFRSDDTTNATLSLAGAADLKIARHGDTIFSLSWPDEAGKSLPLSSMAVPEPPAVSEQPLSFQCGRQSLDLTLPCGLPPLTISVMQTSRYQRQQISLQGLQGVYGLGEKTGSLNKQGRWYLFWNTDHYQYRPDSDPLYISIPLALLKTRHGWCGLFWDNPARSYLDLRQPQQLDYIVEEGGIRLWILAGPALAAVVAQYTQLTGRMPEVPEWSLGYHQSRYSYNSLDEVEQLVAEFRRRELPLDAVHLDLAWLDKCRAFTRDQAAFSNMRQRLAAMQKQGVHFVGIHDPHLRVQQDYAPWQEAQASGYLVTDSTGQPFKGRVWPGECGFPDFLRAEVRQWWAERTGWLFEQGLDGLWNDMNEPSVFVAGGTINDSSRHQLNGQPCSHRSAHNLYGLSHVAASAQAFARHRGEPGFILSRSGYAGIQRYAAVWTGDNSSSWAHLRQCIPMLLNLGLSGVPFAGCDVGGYTGSPGKTLFIRWLQLGTFLPFFRNHTEIDSPRQEPWAFDRQTEAICRRYLNLRQQLKPVLRQLVAAAQQNGSPIMRPMFWHYVDDAAWTVAEQQFMLGANILVAPVLRPGQRRQRVWLPDSGQWQRLLYPETFPEAESGWVEIKNRLDWLPVWIKKDVDALNTR